MLSRNAKALYYQAMGPVMRFNSVAYRALRAPRGPIKAHLGPGQKNYLLGWVNVDANMFTGKCDVWADLRNSLPFRSNSLSACYSHHVIEHLPDLQAHFAEVMRCLAPGGVYRVGGPNGDSAIAKFIAGESGWFGDYPSRRRSIGGRLENFVFCKGEHVTILTRSFLTELLEDAGFVEITPRQPIRETGYPELFGDALKLEYESDFAFPHTLLLEAVKPVKI